ncbi:RING/U-box superfamily protein [Quillaja saponaria]|nr:RING/U-box superfamily protein [Quillaja saponaria]
MKASSVFVEQIEATNDYNNGVLLYSFSEKPELSCQANWSVSNFLIVTPYSHKGFSLWLNKGSKINMRWEAQTSTLNQTEVVVIKGERKYETLQPKRKISPDDFDLSEPITGEEAEYIIEEDDRFTILPKLRACAQVQKASCKLNLLFPHTHYVILTTPHNGDLGGWHVDVSFMARVVIYIILLGFIMVVVLLILKYLGACDGDQTNRVMVDIYETHSVVAAREVTETQPIMREKPNRLTYGTNEEDEESGASSSSSEELYDEKLCVICYDEQRNCFFVPCGHCATCYDCAQRIMDGEGKVCPICRRLIHKVRRLFNS